MKYYSTRNKSNKVSSMEAIIKGISDDGGLFVPERIPSLPDLERLKNVNYMALAEIILGMYFDDFSDEEITQAVQGAYGEKFNEGDPVKIKYQGGAYFLELFHGPTLAFKDMALTILPYLMKTALSREGINEEVVILTATSGDTGKAALEGFRDIPGVNVVVFYPKNGVSAMQELQMKTQQGKNNYVIALDGNFDDAQKGVKEIFADEEFNQQLQMRGYRLSSANSINIGRLVPQIIYYVYSYLTLLKENKIGNGELINVVVPTGNFGNILAAYYAKEMGLPIDALICASNDNNVLTTFIETGVYDKKRDLLLTSSPSMDILVSSNLERFLFHVSGNDEATIKLIMNQLEKEGSFQWGDFRTANIYGECADENDVSNSIKTLYKDEGYLIDPHTAVGYSVYQKYLKETGDDKPTLIASTASPFKFPDKVIKSIELTIPNNLFQSMDVISQAIGIDIPLKVKELEHLPILHGKICTKKTMKDVVLNLLARRGDDD